MKKNILSLAVAASAAGMTGLSTAQMYVNTEHTGEALIFPFYSAQNGNASLISIVNTTSDFKAVKVRIIEGLEAEKTLDFNLYMSPQDHFSFAVAEDGDGAKLLTNDTSCTVPEITDGEQAFTDLLWVEEDGDGNPLVGSAQGREQAGYIEVIEMGQVILTDLTEAISHVGGTPVSCETIRNAWSVEGAWSADANAEDGVGTTGMGLTWNGGGLYGAATVINVAEGTAFGYDAVAIENLVDDDVGHSGAALHYAPVDTRPDFSDVAISGTATVAISGEQVTYTSPDQSYHTVSAVLMSESISNDYIVDPGLNALTDWVVTMPTKSYYESVTLGWTEPFTNDCEPFSLAVYDREEGSLAPPANGVDPVLCSESTIVHFGAASATNTGQTSDADRTLTNVNGLLSDEDRSFDAGWAVMDLSGDALNNPIDNDRRLPGTLSGGGQLVGLPVTGFAVVEYTNGTLGSAIANYQSAWEHKTSIATSSSSN